LPELPDVQGKDAAHLLNGRWIVECGELDMMRRASMTAVKDFLTRPIDVYRKPYGRNVVRRPRSVVFAGTTNDYQSLNDPTGARRFWPVRCGNIDAKKLRELRDKLWAEACSRFEAGERWWPTPELSAAIADEQEERFQEDSWTSIILSAAARHQLAPFTLADCMNWLGVAPDKWTRASDSRVGAILHRAGYRSSRQRVRMYSRPGVKAAASEPESDFDE
jgi:putative DNA primase/helicase